MRMDTLSKNTLVLFIAALISIVGLFSTGCEERNTPVIHDSEVITQYIYEAEEAQGLFRTDSLFLEEPFTIPFDSATYQVIVDSVQRSIEVEVFVDSIRYDNVNKITYRIRHDYGSPFGELWDAEAVVDDRFFVTILRIVGSDTTSKEEQRLVTRYGYFLKLGDDTQPYLGWKLWGYNGGAPYRPMQMEVHSSDGSISFRGDNVGYDRIKYTVIYENLTTDTTYTLQGASRYLYMRTDQLGKINDGEILIVQATDVPNESWYQSLSGLTDNGYVKHLMYRPDSSQYIDTIQTASNHRLLWNLLFVQETRRFFIPNQVVDTMGTNWYGWCIPYWVNQ